MGQIFLSLTAVTSSHDFAQEVTPESARRCLFVFLWILDAMPHHVIGFEVIASLECNHSGFQAKLPVFWLLISGLARP